MNEVVKSMKVDVDSSKLKGFRESFTLKVKAINIYNVLTCQFVIQLLILPIPYHTSLNPP